MAITDFSQRDYNRIPAVNFTIEQRGAAVTAATAEIGRIYQLTGTGAIMAHRNATTVVRLDGFGVIDDSWIASGAAIALSKLATDPLARANHTGTQLAATISNLAATVQAYRLDQFAAPTSAVGFGGQRITSISDASASTDAPSWLQVQNLVANSLTGQDWKASVRVATTAAGTLASSFANGSVVDGITLATGDRILIKNQASGSENGIYTVNASGAPTRATDADNTGSASEVTAGMTVPVEGGGTANGGSIWLLTNSGAITLGTTALTFTQIGAAGTSYTAGTGLALSGNQFAIENSGVLLLTHGGTGASTAAGARSAISSTKLGATIAQNSALSAGVEATFAHGLATDQMILQVRTQATPHEIVDAIKKRVDSTNVYLTADVAVSSNTLEVVCSPIVA